jgi:hypothetical protein
MDVESKIVGADLVRQVAEVLFNEQFATNWRFYALVGGITFLANIVWHMFAPYLKKRGEILATKADMAEILRQVSETTRVTEEVRSSVSLAEWVSREWRTTRRLKLEELLSTAYKLDQYVDASIDKWINQKDVIVSDVPSERMQMLGTLYFPELRNEILRVRLAYLAVHNLIINSSEEIRVAKNANDIQAVSDGHTKFRAEYKQLYPEAHSSVLGLAEKAAQQMSAFAH